MELRSQLAQRPLLRIASAATLALNFGLYCFRVIVIASPLRNDSAKILTYCLV